MSSLVFHGPISWPPYHSENLSQFSWIHRFSTAQGPPFEHDASFWGLEDTCLSGFRMALKFSISQPLVFSLATTPLPLHYALHKCFGHDSFSEAEGIKGRRELKAPGSSDWTTQEEVKSSQIIIYHLPSALPHPFSHGNKVIGRGNIWLLWANSICPSPCLILSLPLPLGSCIFHSYSISLKSLLKEYYPIYRPYGIICPSSSLWLPCTQTSSEYEQYLPTSFIRQLSMARIVLAAKDRVMSRTNMVLWELTSHIPQQEIGKRVTQ